MKLNSIVYVFISFTLIVITNNVSYAQLKSVRVGVDGLMCSACCRSVEMSIRKLSFVKDVKINLDNSEGQVFFMDTAKVNVEGISRAVVKAGYSVRYLKGIFNFDKLSVSNGYCFHTENYNLQFTRITKKVLDGETELKFIGERFLPKHEFNKIKSQLTNSCPDKNEKVFFVTL